MIPIVMAVMFSASCDSSRTAVDGSGQPALSRIGDSIEISLADLLGRPREELAQLSEEWVTKIRIQEKGLRQGKLPLSLLPNLHLPLVMPVWREASYSAKAGFSLPPYAAAGAKDSGLALNLARYGDFEAARQLVEPGDQKTLERIENGRFERDYPVEWTRLVALLLHASQLRLATGDVDGATELIVLHRQLRELLDAKAAQGALGADLFSRGRKVLTEAAAAWRAEKKGDLAGQADAAVAAWGTTRPLEIAVQFGVSSAEIDQLLKSETRGRASSPPSTIRALDLLALPFPDEGADAVISCFDEAGKLHDVFVTYRAGLSDYYPGPENLAHFLEDCGLSAKDSPAGMGLRRLQYVIGNSICDVATVTHGAGLGAIVHFSSSASAPVKAALPRDFGAIHLDRSFEQNRLKVTPGKRNEALLVQQPAALAQIANPIKSMKPALALVRMESGHDLVTALTISYITDASGPPPFHEVVLPIWAKLGPCLLQGETDANGGHLSLVWQDPQTRYVLALPYESGQQVVLQIADRQGPEQIAARKSTAAGLDRKELDERLKARKPLLRIPRQLEQIELGAERAQVLRALPTGRAVLKRDIPGGVMVTFGGDPSRTDAYVARQLFVRFDSAGRVAEVRVRYADGPAGHGNSWMAEILRNIKKECGASLDAESPWSKLWHDLAGGRQKAVRHYWRDDLTLLTYQRDQSGVELTLRESPPDATGAAGLPALVYLPRGPEQCVLGEERSKFMQQFGSAKPGTTEDGALLVRLPAGAPYDILLAWFDKDRVVRVIARHSSTNGSKADPAQWGQMLSEMWGKDLRTLGWPRRQDSTPNEILQNMGWHDDRTRVRIFWQESDSGAIHLYSEWQELPKENG